MGNLSSKAERSEDGPTVHPCIAMDRTRSVARAREGPLSHRLDLLITVGDFQLDSPGSKGGFASEWIS